MATHHCANHPRRKAEALCMGCGQWFCPACIQAIKDVSYCRKCAETIGEDYRSLAEQIEVDRDSPGYIRRVTADAEDQWEKSFHSAQMIPVTRRRLRALKRPVDLGGTVAGLLRRGVACAIDLMITVGLVALAYAIVAAILLGGTSPPGGEPMVLAAGAVGGLSVSVLLRFVFLTLFGQTIGQLFAGIRIVSLRGIYAGPILSFGRALFDTFFDVLLLPHLINIFLVRPAQKKGSLSDTIVGTHTVRVGAWRRKAQETIYEEDRARLLGAET